MVLSWSTILHFEQFMFETQLMQQLHLDCLTVKAFSYSKLVQKHLKELVSGWESCTQPWFSYLAHKLSKFLRMNPKQVWLQMLLVPIEHLEIRRKSSSGDPRLLFYYTLWWGRLAGRNLFVPELILSGSPSAAEEGERAPTPHPNSDCFHMTSRNKAFALSQGCMMKVYLKLWGVIVRVWVPHVVTEKHVPSWEDTSQTSIFEVIEHW